MYGSVVCTPPTRRSVYTHQWKCTEVYTVYTSNFFRIHFSRFSNINREAEFVSSDRSNLDRVIHKRVNV